MSRSGDGHDTCVASPGEIRPTLLTLDLAVAIQILMQLAVRDIGQVTDIQKPRGYLQPADPEVRKPLVPTQLHMAVSGTADA